VANTVDLESGVGGKTETAGEEREEEERTPKII
jgi:hypothetical protein